MWNRNFEVPKSQASTGYFTSPNMIRNAQDIIWIYDSRSVKHCNLLQVRVFFMIDSYCENAFNSPTPIHQTRFRASLHDLDRLEKYRDKCGLASSSISAKPAHHAGEKRFITNTSRLCDTNPFFDHNHQTAPNGLTLEQSPATCKIPFFPPKLGL